MKSTPPLLVIAEGRRARPRRCPLANPREIVLHKATVDILAKLGDPSWRWSHFPSGELRDVRTAARLKAMGLKRGWPDIVLVSPVGKFHGLELKRLGEDLTDDQQAFQMWAIRHGIRYAIAWTLDEATTILGAWGAIRPVRDAG